MGGLEVWLREDVSTFLFFTYAVGLTLAVVAFC